MEDDFNTAGAIGHVNTLINDVNRFATGADLENPSKRLLGGDEIVKATLFEHFKHGVKVLRTLSSILGLFSQSPEAKKLGGDDALVTGLMQLLIDLRSNIRAVAKEAAKDNPLKKPMFDQTDLIRKRLADLGVTLEDRPAGTTWRVG
jgi:cysteinyl-tRNA synthetase